MVRGSFSTDLERWLADSKKKTFGDLQDVFDEKSFAILFLLCLFLPSLPLPTGGIDVVLLPVAMIAAMQMVFGRRSLWLPRRIARIPLGQKTLKSALPFMMKRIRWFEKFSRPRKPWLFSKAYFRTIIGITVFLFAFSAIVAPPFSWLDTLPALGGVCVALSILLDDFALYVLGLVIGTVGVGLLVTAAGAIFTFFERFF